MRARTETARKLVKLGLLAVVSSVFFLGQAFAKDNVKDKALLEAAATCRVETVKELLNDGTNPNARDDRGETPLHWAIGGCVHQVLNSYHWTSNSESEGASKGVSPKFFKCLQVARLLLEKGADVDAKNRLGDSALESSVASVHLSARRASPEGMKHFRRMLLLLLDHGARLDLKHPRMEGFLRYTPDGYRKTAEFLKAHGTNK